MKSSLILKRILGIVIVAIGMCIWYITKMNLFGIILGVIVILVGCVFVSSTTPEERAALEKDGGSISMPYNMTIEEVFDIVKDHKYITGEPWLGRVTMVNNRCIIWGPHWHDMYIYAYLSTDGQTLYFAWSANKHMVVGPEETFLEHLRRYPANYKLHENFNAAAYIKELAPLVEKLLSYKN